MRHRSSTRKLGRTASHRKAMLRTLVTQLLDKEKIITTLPKAKELRSVAEKMITLGKRETLHARRQALAYIRDKGVVFKLFDSVAPRFASRNGGYTRIIKLGSRTGDGAELALIELTGAESTAAKAPAREEKATKEKKPATEKTAGGEARKTKKVASSKEKAAPAEKPARKRTRKKAETD